MKQKINKSIAWRLCIYLFSRQKGKITVILISIIFSTLAALMAPLILAKAIDHIADGMKASLSGSAHFQINLHTMGGLVGILLALYLLNFSLKYIEQYLMASIAETSGLSMRKDLSQKLSRVPLRFYDITEKGEILSRATNDVEKVVEVLREGIGQFITALLTLIGAITMMLYISPLFTAIALLIIGFSTIITAWIAKQSRKSFSTYQTLLGHLNANIEEAFTGQIVLKAFNHEGFAVEQFSEINEELCEASRKSQIFMYIVSPVVRLMNSFGYIIIAILSAFAIIQGKFSIGTVQAFIQYLDKAGEPLIECSYIVNTMQSALASATRFFEIMDAEEETMGASYQKLPENLKGAVSFQHVQFGYSDEHILMKDINLNLKPGDKVAIVGPTGAGKSTLVNLLMRFYDIQNGCIKIDGIPINKLKRCELRRMFGMVLQDTWLFGGTIENNITYSKPDASKEEIIAAAKAARIDHFIRTMPDGYQTILTEEGSNLSQGQRQLLTIARVILADPALLILDEATSSVDTRTELEIQKAMDYLMQDRTSFIIAHRLSTIRDADLILVMNNGTIIEQGTHTQLLTQKGFYENLYNSQFAG